MSTHIESTWKVNRSEPQIVSDALGMVAAAGADGGLVGQATTTTFSNTGAHEHRASFFYTVAILFTISTLFMSAGCLSRKSGCKTECQDGSVCRGRLCISLCSSDKDCVGPEFDVPHFCNADVCEPSSCGDGVRQGIEECDDGNNDDRDACTSACIAASCGDRLLRADVVDTTLPEYEVCDDGNTDDNDACTSSCEPARCGDGYTRTDVVGSSTEGYEACDDANDNDDDDCTNDCRLNCGNGELNSEEACDDDNTNDEDSCTNSCELASCGDGIVRTDVLDTQDPAYEVCDDGNNDDADACTSTCREAQCGDGIQRKDLSLLDPGFEACDDGNDDDWDGCLSTCVLPTCGDGITRVDLAYGEVGAEVCDSDKPTCNDQCMLTGKMTGSCGNFVDVDGDGIFEKRTQTTYNADGKMLQRIGRDAEGVVISKSTMTYDAAGNSIRYEQDQDGNGVLDYVAVYTRDSNGVLRGRVEDRDNDLDGTWDLQMTYTYNANGDMLTQAQDNNRDGSVDALTTNFYNANGTLIKSELDWGGNGSAEYRTTYSLNGRVVTRNSLSNNTVTNSTVTTSDANGRVVERTTDSNGDGTVNMRDSYLYNSEGAILSYIQDTNADGTADYTQTTVYTYNGDGKPLTSKQTDTNGVYENATYTYDDNGNLARLRYDNSTGTDTWVYGYDVNGRRTRTARDTGSNGSIDEESTQLYNEYGQILRNTQDPDGDGETPPSLWVTDYSCW